MYQVAKFVVTLLSIILLSACSGFHFANQAGDELQHKFGNLQLVNLADYRVDQAIARSLKIAGINYTNSSSPIVLKITSLTIDDNPQTINQLGSVTTRNRLVRLQGNLEYLQQSYAIAATANQDLLSTDLQPLASQDLDYTIEQQLLNQASDIFVARAIQILSNLKP